MANYSSNSAASKVLAANLHVMDGPVPDGEYAVLQPFASLAEALGTVQETLGEVGRNEVISEEGQRVLDAARYLLMVASTKLKVLERNGLKL